MAIRNINTIQNHTDFSYISSLSDKYILESLSNLGQRFSLKGDSIKTDSFTPLSIINKTENDFVEEKLISKLSIIEDKLYLQFYNIDEDNIDLVYSEEISHTVNSLVASDAPIRLDNKINGIDYYNSNLYIYLNEHDNTLNITSLGSDTEMGIVELNAESYNIDDNKLRRSLKLINTNDDYYYIYYLFADAELKYHAYKCYINKNNIDDIYGSFENYALSIYNSTIKEYYNEYSEINIADIFSEIVSGQGWHSSLNIYDEDTGEELPVSVNYDVELKGFYVDGEYGTEMNPVLNYIYNQTVYMYKFMFDYYCDYVYRFDNNQLNKYILYKIFNKAFEDSNLSKIEEFSIYIPVNYEFNYYCKDVDSFYIYSNETPVSIFYTPENINIDYLNFFFEGDYGTIILAQHDLLNKVVLYKYSINYNKDLDNVINNVLVSDMYTTPYIMDDYWVINNQRTKYKAIGQDAGNPNIILMYTNNISDKIANGNTSNVEITDSDYKLLTTVNADILKSMNWKVSKVNVDVLTDLEINKTEYNLITSDTYDIYTLVPNVDSNFQHIDKLQGALIINMSSIDNLITDIYYGASENNGTNEKYQIKQILGEDALITTFWVYNSSINAFENIKNPKNDNKCLTFSNISNINRLITKQINSKSKEQTINIDPNKTRFSIAVFETGYLTTKNVFTENYAYVSLFNNDMYGKSNIIDSVGNHTIFEIRYTKHDPVLDINGINRGNDTRFIEEDNTLLNGYVIPVSNIGNSLDYVPSISVPLFNEAEYFSYNTTALNRVNICSLDAEGKLHYAYIGTSKDEADKKTLHIGTGNKGTGIGTEWLMTEGFRNNMEKHDRVSLDFDEIDLTYGNPILSNAISFNVYKNSADGISSKLYNVKCMFSNLLYRHVGIIDNKYNITITDIGQLNESNPDGIIYVYNAADIKDPNNLYNSIIGITPIFALVPIKIVFDNMNISGDIYQDVLENNSNMYLPVIGSTQYMFTRFENAFDGYNIVDLTVYVKIISSNDKKQFMIINDKYGKETLPISPTFINQTI